MQVKHTLTVGQLTFGAESRETPVLVRDFVFRRALPVLCFPRDFSRNFRVFNLTLGPSVVKGTPSASLKYLQPPQRDGTGWYGMVRDSTSFANEKESVKQAIGQPGNGRFW
jgi:hypothetical protein